MDAVFAEIDEIRKMPGNNVRILKHVLNGVAEMQGRNRCSNTANCSTR